MRTALLLSAALTLWQPQPALAQAPCRQALALGLDVSGSVDSGEYLLQMRGLANALRHPDVTAALLSAPGTPVHLAVYEWSAPAFQRLLVDWTAITGPEAVAGIAARLEAARRAPAPPVTGLGQAMLAGAALLAQRPGCWKRTLDISGDGQNNAGPRPGEVRAELLDQGFTLNALVIGSESPDGARRQDGIGELIAYFRARVILGPDAFVESALGFEDYEAAMVRKLKRELEGLAVSGLAAPAPDAPGVQ